MVAFCLVWCSLLPHSWPGTGPCGRRQGSNDTGCLTNTQNSLKETRMITARASFSREEYCATSTACFGKLCFQDRLQHSCTAMCLAHHRSWHDGFLRRRWRSLRRGLKWRLRFRLRLGLLPGTSAAGVGRWACGNSLSCRQLNLHQLFYARQDTTYH